jgi:hypothetical protein
MKKQMLVLIMATALVIPATGFAMKSMDHSSMSGMDHSKEMVKEKSMEMDHGSMKGMDHGSMDMDGKMIMLGNEKVDGVMGMFHLNDVREKMAEHGMSQTHHIMVAFEDADGMAVESGVVAVKVEDPDEKIGEAIKLMGMEGHFGVDLTLDKKGMYHFKIATKLADGKKRVYHMHYENK